VPSSALATASVSALEVGRRVHAVPVHDSYRRRDVSFLLSERMRVAFQVMGAADQIVEAATVRVAGALKC
jgi:hypothetical protein